MVGDGAEGVRGAPSPALLFCHYGYKAGATTVLETPGAFNDVSGFPLCSSHLGLLCLVSPKHSVMLSGFFSSQLNLITGTTGKVSKLLLYQETMGIKVLHL